MTRSAPLKLIRFPSAIETLPYFSLFMPHNVQHSMAANLVDQQKTVNPHVKRAVAHIAEILRKRAFFLDLNGRKFEPES